MHGKRFCMVELKEDVILVEIILPNLVQYDSMLFSIFQDIPVKLSRRPLQLMNTSENL